MMKRYIYDKNGIFRAVIEVKSRFDTFPTKSTDVEPPALNDGEYARWDGESWQIITELPVKPNNFNQELTSYQMRKQLLIMNKLNACETAMNSAPTGFKVDWEYKPVLYFNDDMFNELPLTSEEKQRLFTEGAAI